MKRIGILACLLLGIMGAAHAADRRVVIRNKTSVAILSLYASNIDTGSWEEDILHDEIIPAWTARRANIDDGTGHCHYDLKAVFADGTVVTKRDLNVCSTTSWTIEE